MLLYADYFTTYKIVKRDSRKANNQKSNEAITIYYTSVITNVHAGLLLS